MIIMEGDTKNIRTRFADAARKLYPEKILADADWEYLGIKEFKKKTLGTFHKEKILPYNTITEKLYQAHLIEHPEEGNSMLERLLNVTLKYDKYSNGGCIKITVLTDSNKEKYYKIKKFSDGNDW